MKKIEKLALLFVENMPITENEWINILEQTDDGFNEILVNRYRKDVYRIAYTHGQTFGYPKIDTMISSDTDPMFLEYLNKSCEMWDSGDGWYYNNIEADFLAKFIALFYTTIDN